MTHNYELCISTIVLIALVSFLLGVAFGATNSGGSKR